MNEKPVFKKLILVLSPVMLLASCGGQSPSSSSIVSSESTAPSFTDVKSVVDYLAQTNNFTLDIEVVKEDGSTDYSYSRYYTSEYVYDEGPTNGWGYGKLGSDYVELAPVNEEVTIGYKVEGKTTLYDGTFLTFKDFGADLVSGSENISLTSKKSKLLFLNLFNFDSDQFSNIKDASMSFYQGSVYGYITIGSSFEANFVITNIGTTKADDVEYALSHGKAYENDDNDSVIYELFAENNYQRNCYDDSGTYIGAEHFLPRYFYGEYTDEYKAASGAYSYGLVGLDNVKLSSTISEGLVKGTVYNGSYYYSIYGGAVSVVTTNPYNVNPNVSSKDVYNYPSNMKMWNKLYMFEHFDDGEKAEFISKRIDFAVDFAKNFQVYDTLVGAGCTPSSLTLEGTDLYGTDAKVVFKLGYMYQKTEYYAEFEFTNFGTANMQPADAFLEKVDRLNVNE